MNLILTKLARDRTWRIACLSIFYTDHSALVPYSIDSRSWVDILPVRPLYLVNKMLIFFRYVAIFKPLLFSLFSIDTFLLTPFPFP